MAFSVSGKRGLVPRSHWVGDDGRTIVLEAQGQLFRLKYLFKPQSGGGERGAIQKFSRQSRKRMLERLARLDWGRVGYVCFITLTYPDRMGRLHLLRLTETGKHFLNA